MGGVIGVKTGTDLVHGADALEVRSNIFKVHLGARLRVSREEWIGESNRAISRVFIREQNIQKFLCHETVLAVDRPITLER